MGAYRRAAALAALFAFGLALGLYGQNGAAPQVPGAAPQVPGAAPQVPGAAPQVSGAAPQVSGAAPQVPGAAPQAALPALGFRAEGPSYVASASAQGGDEGSALAAGRQAALGMLLTGLGRDRLFSQLFIQAPPLGLEYRTEALVQDKAGAWTAFVVARVDDESVRILARGPYLVAATALLDQAEAALAEAEPLLPAAEEAESAGILGEALGRYGQILERAQAALSLLDPLAEPSVFSTKGGRSVADLRLSLQALASTVEQGIARVREAERVLASDAAGREAAVVIDTALREVEEGRALLEESGGLLDSLGTQSRERLLAFRTLLESARRDLDDAGSALERSAKALEKERPYLKDRYDFARRRLASADAGLREAWSLVDREIRDPAAARAARAQAFRWVFLHESNDWLQLRAWLPFMVGLPGGEDEGPSFAFTGLWDLRVRAEGAFGERGGVWARAGFLKQDSLLGLDTKETVLAQSFDLGFWGRSLWFLGYGWDWLRMTEGESPGARSQLRFGFGGIAPAYREATGRVPARNDWLLLFSYEFPLPEGELPVDSLLWNKVNAGLETQLRLGRIALLEGSVEARSRLSGEAGDRLLALLRFGAGFALRAPGPFAWGFEYTGSFVWEILNESGDLGPRSAEGQGLRFFVEYSI